MHEGLHTPPWYPLPRAFRVVASEMRHAVLLETARQDGNGDRSLLFLHPVEELVAWDADGARQLLRDVDRHVAHGLYVAGYFTYECGEVIAGLPVPATARPDEPLAWLGVFEEAIVFDHSTGVTTGVLPPAPQRLQEEAIVHTHGLSVTRADYDSALARIQEYLAAGDTYQVNFTTKVHGRIASAPLVLYETLLRQQAVPFAAYVNSPFGPVLSFSPELFFRTSQGHIEVRPMKGTWARGRNLAEDESAVQELRSDEKNCSEHVMILDLLRNDLGRICKYGSISVDKAFEVERYATLLQMTSTVSGVLQNGVSPSQVFANLFPSGSITGAPKLRTMEIIRDVEQGPRGVYTGSIGYFGLGGEACFNVAIRTVQLRGEELAMGVGGGITADSKADEEFAECELKGAFLTRRRPRFSLIETMRCEGGIPLLRQHMQRLADSAQYFGIRWDEEQGWEAALSASILCGGVSKVRLELNEAGECSFTSTPLDRPIWNGRLLLVEERTQSKDVFLHHKTTVRQLYDRNYALALERNYDEALFLNEQSHVTEGAISNVFLRTRGRWITPKLGSGVLPGIQRAVVCDELRAIERDVVVADFAKVESILVCNALRGVRQVNLIKSSDGALLWERRVVDATQVS